MQCFAPDLHTYYSATLEKLHMRNTHLRHLFPCSISVFATMTFNFSLQMITLPHLNFANLAWGAHLILWDLKLIIRFPPGCTILIPSALIRHSNTSIQAHKKCFSFTQYSAAGIFRFVDNGFHSDAEVNTGRLTEAEKAACIDARKRHWTEGLKMYSCWEEHTVD
ncbi:hypothetical protein K438DRAFT_1908613 [Mycena galopus ATCC 62051]|nr:hypothetical protein K438DRAFT_1908613 [Mycena galopus ATCC 62051]